MNYTISVVIPVGATSSDVATMRNWLGPLFGELEVVNLPRDMFVCRYPVSTDIAAVLETVRFYYPDSNFIEEN